MKLVVNSAYGYLGAGRAHALRRRARGQRGHAPRPRACSSCMCRELAARGVTLLEADTDGVYFAVPDGLDRGRRAARRRRGRRAPAAARPARVRRPLRRDALARAEELRAAAVRRRRSLLRGVAFRSSRAEPFGEAFLRRAARAPACVGDVAGVRDAYLDDGVALRRRAARDARRLVARAARRRRRRNTSRRARHGASSPTRRCSRAAASAGPSAIASACTALAAVAPACFRTLDEGEAPGGDARSARLRRRLLRARPARHVRGAAGARAFAGGLRRRLRRSRAAVAVREPLSRGPSDPDDCR